MLNSLRWLRVLHHNELITLTIAIFTPNMSSECCLQFDITHSLLLQRLSKQSGNDLKTILVSLDIIGNMSVHSMDPICCEICTLATTWVNSSKILDFNCESH